MIYRKMKPIMLSVLNNPKHYQFKALDGDYQFGVYTSKQKGYTISTYYVFDSDLIKNSISSQKYLYADTQEDLDHLLDLCGDQALKNLSDAIKDETDQFVDAVLS